MSERFFVEQAITGSSAALAGTEFTPYKTALEAGGQVKAINVKGGAKYSRKQLDELTEVAKRYGAGGMATVKLSDGGEVSSSLTKALGEEKVAELASTVGCVTGDCMLIVGGKSSVVAASLSALRLEVAERENLIDQSKFNFLWVVDFPMFEYHEDEGRWYAMHHPFTSPHDEDLPLLESEPGRVRAKAYDLLFQSDGTMQQLLVPTLEAEFAQDKRRKFRPLWASILGTGSALPERVVDARE